MSSLQEILQTLKDRASNKTEQGYAFEQLVKVFLENDAIQTQHYSRVWHYSDWAKEHPEYPTNDIGIDLVAKLRDEEGYCAIQCKFYQSHHGVSKRSLDSFISASSSSDFTRLMIIDTTNQEISDNARSVIANLSQDFVRIQLSDIEGSQVDWKFFIKNDGKVRLHPKRELRDDQIQAMEAVKSGLKESDRGKLIMACGTGKTFTSLRIAEELAGVGQLVLYLVPSLALMSQTIREWKNDAADDFTAFSVCSDKKVGRRKRSEDRIELSLLDLAFPATTDPERLSQKIASADPSRMTVVFSTYQSIDVISRAQHEFGVNEFDLIVCDEAHRTTGATFGDDESNFVRIHDNKNVKGRKRLYMTATPRIYGESAKKKADDGEVTLASMDNEALYGKILFQRGFGWAVQNNLLTDYKVVVLAMDEELVSYNVQNSLAAGKQLLLDDATKMVGCYKALAKIGISEERNPTLEPMHRALAFCQNIAVSKMFAEQFKAVTDEYTMNEDIAEKLSTDFKVELHHVDGTFNAEQRNEKLDWLKEDTGKNICRVLTNARCLSEGVDVPDLDAIMFLHPKKSQIEVVQSVGRVMRLADGKDLGYVIIPIAVAPGVSPEKALDDNERYKVVWQILNALRAHDERLDRDINKIRLGEDVSDRIEIIDGGIDRESMATTAVVEDVQSKTGREIAIGDGRNLDDCTTDALESKDSEQLSLDYTDLSQAIMAKIVEKCGTRDYWENWAKDIARIAQAHIDRISGVLANSTGPERRAFDDFLVEIRRNLNPEVSEGAAVEMLAQHIITRPVFDALFLGNKFTQENVVSRSMETALGHLYSKHVDDEARTLARFYQSVQTRAEGIVTAAGRQTLIKDLYDRFFRSAFPIMTKRLGIVYTPVEVVDFIIFSVNDVLQDEFRLSVSDENVHILDPFSGTGTFITRLLQSDLINKEQLPHKYKHEIHANELVLLAYYVACINIEAVYADIMQEDEYQPYNGMILADTFQMFDEKWKEQDSIPKLLPDNFQRSANQKKRKITIIITNPPYSIGQRKEDDNAANANYSHLDQRIQDTYANLSSAKLKRGLYDSYIRAIRWATDRIGNEGVIGFVCGSGWIEKRFADGMRRSLAEEFSAVYVVNLRGDVRKDLLSSGKTGEGGNIFGEGSMTGTCILILVKKGQSESCSINYFKIGDNNSRSEKLAFLSTNNSIRSLMADNQFTTIIPDENYDWVNLGDKAFRNFVSIGNKGSSEVMVFKNYSLGIATNRDPWCYNFSASKLKSNINSMLNFFHNELVQVASNPSRELVSNPKRICWTHNLKRDAKLLKKIQQGEINFVVSQYRPYNKQFLCFSRRLNERVSQIPRIFDTGDKKNLVIAVSGKGSRNGLTALMCNAIPDLNLLEAGAQCFPLKLFEKSTDDSTLFSNPRNNELLVSTNGISRDGLQFFKDAYTDESFSAEDLFYYIYGILHAPDYRHRFGDNLFKELPRIPVVRPFNNFMTFSKAGRKLGNLHVNYEFVEPYPISFREGDLKLIHISDPISFFRVEKMKFARRNDKTSVVYNKNLTIENIPSKAWDYVVNGKPALQWVMDRQRVTKDKVSGIINDANDYAIEIMNCPAYPLELFQRVITVSLETIEIVRDLPKLQID